MAAESCLLVSALTRSQVDSACWTPAARFHPTLPPTHPSLQLGHMNFVITVASVGETRVHLFRLFLCYYYIFQGTCFFVLLPTESALWEDAGTHFANVTSRLLCFQFCLKSVCHNGHCCHRLSSEGVPNVSARESLYLCKSSDS